jgi:signal transduction histidine kinase
MQERGEDIHGLRPELLSHVTGLWSRFRDRGSAPGSIPDRSSEPQIPVIRGSHETEASLIHDISNMVAAMDLYCDLLEEPGVLSSQHLHYAEELRLVGSATRRLLHNLVSAESQAQVSQELGTSRSIYTSGSSAAGDSGLESSSSAAKIAPWPGTTSLSNAMTTSASPSLKRVSRRVPWQPDGAVHNLAEELRANQNLLAALAGQGITLGLTLHGGAHPIPMSCEDLTRVLVNLVKNAAEAMPGGGHLQIALEENADVIVLSFTDNGPGIPNSELESIFSPGYSTHIPIYPGISIHEVSECEMESCLSSSNQDPATWPVQHRGLGLSIVRAIVSAAGGTIWAGNRIDDVTLAAWQRGADRPLSGELPGGSENGRYLVPIGLLKPQGALIQIEFPHPQSRPAQMTFLGP